MLCQPSLCSEFEKKKDVTDGEVIGEKFKERLAMMIRDIQVYGKILANQRAADLRGGPNFHGSVEREKLIRFI